MPELFNYSYKVFPFNQAGTLTDFEIPLDGQKIIYMSPSDGPQLMVRLQSKSNDQIALRPQGIIVAPFNRVYISGTITTAFPSLIIASPSDVSIESRDVNVNSIASISTLNTIVNPVINKDFVLDRAQNSVIFERAATLAASAANLSIFQVYNPAGSGRTVVLLGLRYQSDSGGAFGNRVSVRQHNTALGTLVGTFYNVNSGGAASVAELRSAQPAAMVGANILDEWIPAVGLDNEHPLRPRVDVLGEGEGIVVAMLSTNYQAASTMRIWEF